MEGLGDHCSRCERRADDATREAMGWLKTEFMQDKLGQEFQGTISGVTQFGVFVQLDTLQIDGLVHVSALGSEYFDLDRPRYRLIGSQSGRIFQLGDRLLVRVARASLEDRKIDFDLVSKEGDVSRHKDEGGSERRKKGGGIRKKGGNPKKKKGNADKKSATPGKKRKKVNKKAKS
jgi:ribonuclease R